MWFRQLAIAALLAAVSAGAQAEGVAAAPSAPAGVGGPIMGDADCGGVVDAADAGAILAGLALPGVAPCSDLADVNCSGVIDVVDSLAVLLQLIGHGPDVPGCPAIGAGWEEPQTSFARIDEAVESGDIDEGTGVLYKAHAGFGDPKLPAEYESSLANLFQEIPPEVYERPDGLSPEIEAELDAYLVPPDEPGSWYEQIHGSPAARRAAPASPEEEWPFVSSSQYASVKWDPSYPIDEGQAQAIADLANAIRQQYEVLFLLESQPVRVYVMELGPGVMGTATPGEGRKAKSLCEITPLAAYDTQIRISGDLPADQMPAMLARLIMQRFLLEYTFQDTCEDRRWFVDAMSAWAEDFIDPEGNTEHRFRGFFQSSTLPIQAWGRGDAYVYLLYLTRTFVPDALRVVMDKVDEMSVIDAIDATMPGGLQDTFPAFALQGWNLIPANQFWQWDQIPHTPAFEDVDVEVDASGNGDYTLDPLTAEPNELSVNYLRFDIPSSSQRVRVYNPFGLNSGVSVQLLVLDDEGWRIAAVPASGAGASFCQELSPLMEIVAIIANANPQSAALAGNGAKTLMTFEGECGDLGDWYGEVHSTQVIVTPGQPDQVRTIDATDVVFAEIPCDDIAQIECFETIGGQVRFTASGYHSPGCTMEGELTRDIPEGNARLNLFDTTYNFVGGGLYDQYIPVTVTCGQDVSQDEIQPNAWLSIVQYPWPDHNIIQGTYDQDTGAGSVHREWTFQRVVN